MITVSDSAIAHIKQCLEERGVGIGIKFGIETAGCNGLAYNLEYLNAEIPDAYVLVADGVTIAIDNLSIPYLKGTHIDYVTEGLSEGFKFTNPNESAACGCGETFSVD